MPPEDTSPQEYRKWCAAAQSRTPSRNVCLHWVQYWWCPYLRSPWSQGGVIPADRILTYSTAGPVPARRDSRLVLSKADSYRVWNISLCNMLDVTPQVWCNQHHSTSRRTSMRSGLLSTLGASLTAKTDAEIRLIYPDLEQRRLAALG